MRQRGTRYSEHVNTYALHGLEWSPLHCESIIPPLSASLEKVLVMAALSRGLDSLHRLCNTPEKTRVICPSCKNPAELNGQPINSKAGFAK